VLDLQLAVDRLGLLVEILCGLLDLIDLVGELAQLVGKRLLPRKKKWWASKNNNNKKIFFQKKGLKTVRSWR